MLGARTTKSVAARLDPMYHRRWQPLRVARGVVVLAIVIGALLWWGSYALRGDRTLYSPGPVHSSHAMWGADCTWCHTKAPDGSFVQTVSDAACLRCHDGAIHHPNQLTLSAFDPHRNGSAGPRPHGMPATGSLSAEDRLKLMDLRSTNCAACHVEHRGHDALLARADAHCTQCHANLAADSLNAQVLKIDTTVTAFSDGSHPPFVTGAPAADSASRVDPTPLRFNHADPNHREAKIKPLPGQTTNCTVCHQPETSSTALGVYMKPVNYEQHCASCHPLVQVTVGVPLPVPHEQMSLVRGVLAEYALDFVGALKRQGMNEAEAADAVQKAHAAVSELLLNESLDPKEDFAALGALQPAEVAAADARPWIDPRALELIVASRAVNACTKCHDLSNNAQAVQRLRERAGRPMAESSLAGIHATTQPATALATLPTGYAEAPRRWFPHSRFDHAAHRSMNCLECHGKAPTSSKTEDILMPTLQSCTACHHAPTPRTDGQSMAGAGQNCVMCHDYHKHDLEKRGNGLLTKQLLDRNPP